MELTQALVVQDLFDPTKDLSAMEWLPFHPGVDIAELYAPAEDGQHAALLRYQPGANAPFHLHAGYEHIIVLRGSQRDGNGVYPTGTLVVNPPGTSHLVASDEGCIVLAIWQRPVHIFSQPENS